MKIKRFVAVIVCVFISVSFALAQKAADNTTTTTPNNYKVFPKKQPDGTYKMPGKDSSQQPDDSYLARFHAHDVVAKLMKKNLEQIYLLNVITKNYKKGDWRKKYQACYEGYKYAMKLYYRRMLTFSRRYFEKNKKEISDLLKAIAADYRKETEKMLEECASKILGLHLMANTRSNPDAHRKLFNNQSRLRIAYGQFDDAENSTRDHLYDTAIFHFRVAKAYAIQILVDIDGTDAKKRKELMNKYAKDRADNLNRIYEKQK